MEPTIKGVFGKGHRRENRLSTLVGCPNPLLHGNQAKWKKESLTIFIYKKYIKEGNEKSSTLLLTLSHSNNVTGQMP